MCPLLWTTWCLTWWSGNWLMIENSNLGHLYIVLFFFTNKESIQCWKSNYALCRKEKYIYFQDYHLSVKEFLFSMLSIKSSAKRPLTKNDNLCRNVSIKITIFQFVRQLLANMLALHIGTSSFVSHLKLVHVCRANLAGGSNFYSSATMTIQWKHLSILLWKCPRRSSTQTFWRSLFYFIWTEQKTASVSSFM